MEPLFFRHFEGPGKDLVILHGLFGLSDNWVTLGKRFAENFNVFLVDMPNHGQSPHYATHDYELMSERVADLIATQCEGKVVVLGHSMGGKTAMKLAQESPEFIEQLIVADISPRYYPPHHEDVIEAIESVNFTEHERRGTIGTLLMETLRDEGLAAFLLKNITRGEEGFIWRFNKEVILANINDIGEEVMDGVYEGPTLFIRGGDSGYISAADEFDIQQCFPRSEIVTIDGAGHWVHAQKPEEFYEVVMAFLR